MTYPSSVADFIEANLVHSIHVTERRSFRGCRRRWNWVFRDLFYPLVTPKPLEFGVAYHLAAEHWYNPDTWGIDDESRELETLYVFKRACQNQMKEYKAKVDAGLVTQFDSDYDVTADYDARVELGQGMLQQMFKQSYELDKDFRPVGVEVPFEVPITHEGKQLWCKCTRCWRKYMHWANADPNREFVRENFDFDMWPGLLVTYGGRIDCLFEDLYGKIWVVDWKTAMRLSSGEPGSQDDFLLLDDQITSYCWALWTLNVDVAGFIYHEQKKSIPTEPEPLKRPYNGRLYSTNKSNDFEHDVYLQTVREGDPGGFARGLYDEFLDYLRIEGGVYYKRHQIHRNEHELQHAGLNIALEALEMTSADLRLYPSPGRFACNGCAFREPCMAVNRGEDVDYTLNSLYEKRTKAYYETDKPNTDKPLRG
jgi:hypothetical protein